MTHQLSLDDDLYRMLTELASAHGPTPDEVLATLVDEAWEHECAPYDAAFHNDPGWQQSALDAAHRTDSGRSDPHVGGDHWSGECGQFISAD